MTQDESSTRSDEGKDCALCGVSPETQKFCPPEVKCPMRGPAISPQEIVKELHACMHGLNANSAFSGKLTRDAVYRKLSALAGKVAVSTPVSERGTTFTAIGYYDAPSKMTLWEPGKEPPHGALVYRPAERNEQ